MKTDYVGVSVNPEGEAVTVTTANALEAELWAQGMSRRSGEVPAGVFRRKNGILETPMFLSEIVRLAWVGEGLDDSVFVKNGKAVIIDCPTNEIIKDIEELKLSTDGLTTQGISEMWSTMYLAFRLQDDGLDKGKGMLEFCIAVVKQNLVQLCWYYDIYNLRQKDPIQSARLLRESSASELPMAFPIAWSWK